MLRRFIFLGAPGVGKGTFAHILGRRMQIPAISAGDVLREHIAQDGPHAKELKSHTSRGKLVPDELVLSLVYERLSAQDCAQGFILDGLPRNLKQAQALSEHISVDRVVDIRVERWVAIEKMLGRRICKNCKRNFNVASIMTPPYDMPPILPVPEICPLRPNCKPELYQREDDVLNVIQHRFEIYDHETQPVIDFFEDRKMLRIFTVFKGVKDADALYDVMLSP